MRINAKACGIISKSYKNTSRCYIPLLRRYNSGIPFVDLYQKITVLYLQARQLPFLKLLYIEPHHIGKSVIITDSLSHLQDIIKFPFHSKGFFSITPQIKDVLFRCHCAGLEVVLIWIPSHCGITGNEIADGYSKEAVCIGNIITKNILTNFKRKHPNLDGLSHNQLQCTLQILKKFNITPLEACQNVHVFCMNPITMDNYGEILKECGFININPNHIIKYHTLVRSRTIAQLKKEGLLMWDLNLEQFILTKLKNWPDNEKIHQNFSDEESSILTIRISILARYLNWRLSVTAEEFEKYCRNYLPLKHKPMSDIQEAIDIAQNDINLDVDVIKRNGFVISHDPVNTKLILENVDTLAGIDIREAIRTEPAMLKNNYNSILQIRNLLEEYRIPVEAQRRCLKVYCMCPETVQERLNELRGLKEYQVLFTNPRVLSMVIHKKKMLSRLSKIQAAKKQCYSLNHLVSSNRVFNTYLSSFGNKVCGRDLAILISSSLTNGNTQNVKTVLEQLRKHKYWLHSALEIIDGNIKYLKSKFDNDVIFNNCQLLLYPGSEIEYYIDIFLKMRHTGKENTEIDANYNNLKYRTFTDNQILSLALYEIEKKYHFSGDGIWVRQDGVKQELSIS